MANISNPRQLAVITLNQLEETGGFLRELVDAQIRSNDLTRVDQGLYTELVYGTVRMRANLDYILQKYSSRPLAKIQLSILNVLRSALYQILYLDRIPVSAAVNEAVRLARIFGHEGVVKFTNGILRRVARESATITYPSLEDNPVDHISFKYSYPSWIVELWLDWWGLEETLALCQAMNEQPEMHIRVNTLKTTQEEVEAHLTERGCSCSPGRFVPEILKVHPGHLVISDSWLSEGKYYVQDESSALVAHALQVEPGQVVYDLCSAPGGKATHLAQLMKNQGRIMAFDVSSTRLETVEKNAQRLGISIIETRQGDASSDLGLAPAPRVLVDAPCSGLGTMRHRPDIRWSKSKEEIRDLVEIQKGILSQAANYVAPGGLLLYTTCSLTKWENHDVAQWFLANHPQFSPDSFPSWFPETPGEPSWMKTLLPHRDLVDGFYLAIFRKYKV
ncbi:MAG: 16S rRNA (cytosine(967)-C(5))-methyltransferase RsmB [Firmicutes bacterium]|nr:16S rRNA (cytosine(967)-C(5))-methyltransferase RsmB [Bacillota bacterium]